MSSPAVQFRSRVPRLAGSAVERARLTVVPRQRVRAARVPFVTLVSALLVAGVVGLLMFNTSMQQSSFAATALEGQAASLTAREQTLRMELDVLRDPQHVAERAKAMGMVPAENPTFLRLRDGKVLGVHAPASPLDALRINPKAPAKPAELSPPPTYVDAPDQDAGTDAGTDDGTDDGASSSGEGSGPGRTGHQSHQSQQSHQSRR